MNSGTSLALASTRFPPQTLLKNTAEQNECIIMVKVFDTKPLKFAEKTLKVYKLHLLC